MTKTMQEILVGLALTAVAVIALISINTGSDTMFESGRRMAMTSRSFPTILASGMGLLSALFTVGAFIRLLSERRAGPPTAGSVTQWLFGRTALITYGVVALLVAYAWLLKQVHFALLTWIFLFTGFFLFGQRRLLRNAIVAGFGAAAFYGLFVFVLELPLDP